MSANKILLLLNNFKGKNANLDRFDGNCGNPNLPFVMTIESIESRGTKVYLNTTMTVREDIPMEGLQVFCPNIKQNLIANLFILQSKLVLSRCKSRESPDTCEVFLSHVENDVCLRTSSKMWEKFYSAIKPAMNCPLKKV